MTSDGAIKCWGDGIYGQTLVPTMPNPDANPDAVWAHVFAGDRHACGLTTDLAAACWGDSSNGKLAVPTTDDMGNDILGWIKLAAGLQHTCECLGATAMILQLVPWLGGRGLLLLLVLPPLLRPQGLVLTLPLPCPGAGGVDLLNDMYCWGDNSFGQTSVPALTSDSLSWVDVTAGDKHSCEWRVHLHACVSGFEPCRVRLLVCPCHKLCCPSVWPGSTGGIIEDNSADPPIRTVSCWGDGTFGQTNVPVTSVTTNVKWFSIAASDSYTCKRAASTVHQLRVLPCAAVSHILGPNARLAGMQAASLVLVM